MTYVGGMRSVGVLGDQVATAFRNRLEALFSKAAESRTFTNVLGFSIGSTQGPVRAQNQDRAFVVHVVDGRDATRELLVAVILDGMGGMVDGGEAAAVASSAFVENLTASSGAVMRRLDTAAAAANAAVYARFAGRGGTTMTALAFSDRRSASVVHVGDSRLYRLGSSRAPQLLTADDTLQGVIDSKAGRSDEDALDNRLLQFVGMGADVAPTFYKHDNDPDTVWLLTTDGAHGFGRRPLEGASRAPLTPASVVNRLLVGADAFGTEDNATAVAIAPALYAAPAYNFPGLTVRIWTATDHLELWLDHTPAAQSEQSSAPPVEMQETPKKSGRSKKTETGKRTKNSRQKKTVALGTDVGADVAPQLSIKFGRPTSPADE